MVDFYMQQQMTIATPARTSSSPRLTSISAAVPAAVTVAISTAAGAAANADIVLATASIESANFSAFAAPTVTLAVTIPVSVATPKSSAEAARYIAIIAIVKIVREQRNLSWSLAAEPHHKKSALRSSTPPCLK